MLITCKKCSQEVEEYRDGECEMCYKANVNRAALKRRNNTDWMRIAEESEIELYDRQPEETDTEYKVWCAYRDMYPSTKPNLRVVSEILGMNYSQVRHVSARWDFKIRIKAWAKHCDELTMKERQNAIVAMNKTHIDMARTLQDKLKIAINSIDPYELSPKDINGLMKTAAELERKAYGDNTEAYKPMISKDGNTEAKESTTPTQQLPEVLQILMSTGALQGSTIGIETTQRVIVKGDE